MTPRPNRLAGSLAVLAALVLLAGSAFPQSRVSIARPVPGALLKMWLDQNVSYAGTHHSSGCHFINHPEGPGRVLYVRCPDGSSYKLKGTVEVQGNLWCAKFEAPSTPECVSWHKVGEEKFEQLRDGFRTASVYMLSVVPLRVD